MAELLGGASAVLSFAHPIHKIYTTVKDLRELDRVFDERLTDISDVLELSSAAISDLSSYLKDQAQTLKTDETDNTSISASKARIPRLQRQFKELDLIYSELRQSRGKKRSDLSRLFNLWKSHEDKLNGLLEGMRGPQGTLTLCRQSIDSYKLHRALRVFDEYLQQSPSLSNAQQQDAVQTFQQSATLGTTMDGSASSQTRHLDTVHVVIQSDSSPCARECLCQCHLPRDSGTLAMLLSVLGQTFTGYSVIPNISPRCNHHACKRTVVRIAKAEYWFPTRVFWPKIFRLLASAQPNHTPSPEVQDLRRQQLSPIFKSTVNGDIDSLKALFAEGRMDPNDVHYHDMSLLWLAVKSEQWETAVFLSDQGMSPDYRAPGVSENNLRNKTFDIHLQGGLDTVLENALSRMSSIERWAEHPELPALHKVVVNHGDVKGQLAISPEAVNNTDIMGRTALLWAAALGNNDAVRTLLEHNADPNILDCQHTSPLSYAAYYNHENCVDTLLLHNAITDPDIPGGYEVDSPLILAARNAKHPLIPMFLTGCHAKVDARGTGGMTALMHTAISNNSKFAEILVSRNADMNAVSATGYTPLTLAIRLNHLSVLHVLLDHAYSSAYPRLEAPRLLEITAEYANDTTILSLVSANHTRMSFVLSSSTEALLASLTERIDASPIMVEMFKDLLLKVRGQLAQESRAS